MHNSHPPIRRQRRFRRLRGRQIVAPAAVVAVAVLCLWLGGHPEDLPQPLREAFVASSRSGTAAEALALIERDYFRPVNGRALVAGSLEGALESLHDPFSHYLSPSEYRQFASPGSFSGIGLEATGTADGLLIERVFNASPAQRAGLKEGEVIVAVNGRSLKGIPAEAARNMIRGPAGSAVTVTVRFGQRVRTVTVTRAVVNTPAVAFQLKTYAQRTFGWIYLATFSAGAAQEVKEAAAKLRAKGVHGLVLDLRHNGGGLVREAQLIASLFLPPGEVVVTLRSRIAPPLVLRTVGQPLSTTLPLVVLVDHDTASASEILTAALQDHKRAVVVGTHTYGKGVFQELFTLRNGGALDLTVGEFFTPNGRNLGAGGVKEGAGVTPEVPLSPAVVDSERGLAEALRVLFAVR